MNFHEKNGDYENEEDYIGGERGGNEGDKENDE